MNTGEYYAALADVPSTETIPTLRSIPRIPTNPAYRAGLGAQDFETALRCLLEPARALRRSYRTLVKAEKLGLSLILPRLRSEVQMRLQLLEQMAGQVDGKLDRSVKEPPSDSLIFTELRQLDQEFDGFRIDWKEGLVAVKTEPITLEELAEEFGVSRERVRQIEVRAFEKVQKAVKNRVAAIETPAASAALPA